MDIEATLPPARVDARAARRIYRHRLPVRLMHWINVVCLTVLLMSGLNIFNAHPALYWGQESTFAQPWISFGARNTPAGPVGYTRIAGHEFDTTGVLGLSTSPDSGTPMARAFPVVGDDSRPAVAGDGAPLALLLRLDLRHQRRPLPALHDLQQAPEDATSCRRARS
jgi:hypothetical protein